ncbi:MAG: hypothetical protein ACFCGT_23045 [Sandaracinaceae bacterium]
MITHGTPRRRAAALLAVTAAVWLTAPAPARAGNSDAILLGSDAALTGGSVTATTEDGASTYYNPAGLAHIDRHQVNVSAQAIQLQDIRIQDILSFEGGPAIDGGTTVLPLLPAGLTYGGVLSDTVSWGFGIFVQNQFAYTLRSLLQSNVPRPAAVSLAYEDRLIDSIGGVGIGWAALPNLRLGISVMGRYREEYGTLIVSAGDLPGADLDANLAGVSDSFGSQAAGAELRGGVQWEPTPDWVLGAAVWTPTLNIYRAEQQTGVLLERQAASGDDPGRTTYLPFNVNQTTWGFTQLTQWRFRASVAYQGDWGWVGVDGDVQPGFGNEQLGIRRSTTFNVRAGAKILVAPNVHLGLGFFTDRHALPRPDADDLTLSPRVHLYGGTVGVDFDNSHQLSGEEPASISFRTGLSLRVAYGGGDFSTLQIERSEDGLDAQPNVVPATIFEAGIYLTSGLYF